MPAPPVETAPQPDTLRRPLIDRVLRQLPASGMVSPSSVPGLMLLRQDQPEDTICSVYQPCVALVLQGRKQVSFGPRTLRYDAQHFFESVRMDGPPASPGE